MSSPPTNPAVKAQGNPSMIIKKEEGGLHQTSEREKNRKRKTDSFHAVHRLETETCTDVKTHVSPAPTPMSTTCLPILIVNWEIRKKGTRQTNNRLPPLLLKV